ncbi:sigma-54-dependent transcriptional regulator [Azohydromonas lata]|uniref:Sigma-54 dependent transcriptional regulator n=1 Tax=Azohydromonas lata TaxID=45677 RepID=A0ABU5IR43_9BURK|nr:sigma-54 dependent transcriptional regulator [Azohydromonas lata]MDZ5461366.1 sigma-54 dependent transcriptional regulator [Azohydromonas lata]
MTAPLPAADTPIRVLLVEDDEDVRLGSAQALMLAGFGVIECGSVEEARAHVQAGAPLVVLSDVRLPGLSGLQWLAEVQAVDAQLPMILVTGHGDIAMAVGAMRQGAWDFIAKPCSADTLVAAVRRAADKRRLTLQVEQLRAQLEGRRGVESTLLGGSVLMERVRAKVAALAATSADVVIYGETGTGKELVARCLHEQGPRRGANFVALNCGGLPENLAETELFGHEAGAFTGASKVRIGKLEHAKGGTLFLDEIESMPMGLQVKLLRALQERSIERLGSNVARPIDCRVVAAAKEDLQRASEQGRFRADLYYRIGVAFVELPPLRARREDIPLLFEQFTLQAASRYQRAAPLVTPAQLAALMAHPWPGNVRELRNVADRFVLGLLDDSLLPGSGAGIAPSATGLAPPPGVAAAPAGDAGAPMRPLPQQLEDFERAVITQALRQHGGEVAAAARALGIPKQTLHDKLKRLNVSAAEFKAQA